LRLSERLRRASPSRNEVVWGTLLWGAVLCANAAFALRLRSGWSFAAATPVALLFLAGGLLAFAPALLAARLFSDGRGREKRFAALLLCLAVVTVGVSGALYALDYRLYYSQWHAAAFSRLWVFEQAFTAVIALYQFASVGLPLMFPSGFAALFAASYVLSRHPR
jgi:hypothetical protein